MIKFSKLFVLSFRILYFFHLNLFRISNFVLRVWIEEEFFELLLYKLFPSREGIDHICCGKIKGIHDFEFDFPLFRLILPDQALPLIF